MSNILKKYKRIDFINSRLQQLENELENTSDIDKKNDILADLLSLQNALIHWLRQ